MDVLIPRPSLFRFLLICPCQQVLKSLLRINGPVHEFIRSCYSGLESASSTAPVTVTAERIRGDRMKTPFYDILAKVGYDPADD